MGNYRASTEKTRAPDWRRGQAVGKAAAIEPLGLGYAEAALNNFAIAITAPLVVPFAVSLGATGWQVGLITGVPLLAMNLSQVPAARLGRRFRDPRGYLLVSGGLGRVAWLAMALLLLAGHARLEVLLVVATAASLSSGLLTPIWTAFLGEQAPEAQRGSYFGTRNLLAGIAALGGASVAACLVSLLGFQRGNGFALLLAVIATSGAVAAQIAAFGLAAREKASPAEHPVGRPSREWHGPDVRSYIIYGGLLILGAGMATPFYPVQFINQMGGAPQAATTAVAVANALVMLGQGLWGRIIDRLGLRLIGGASLAGIALVPVMWLVARDPAYGVCIWLFNGLMWAACGLATFNLMLAISNDSNRASVVAWVNTLQSPVNFAAPLAGGLIAEQAGLPVLFAAASFSLGLSWIYFLRSFPSGTRASSGSVR